MIHLLNKVPKTITVACSGGVDSMAVLNFLRTRNRNVTVAHFNHGTPSANDMQQFIEGYCKSRGIPYVIGHISREKDSKQSWEEYWRDQRYKFLQALNMPVVTAHHLDDVCEWWIFSSLHGKPTLIPYAHENIIRPFLCTPKSVLEKWRIKKDVPYFEDESNADVKYMRNFIRHKIIPGAFHVNPGFHKVIIKKVLQENGKQFK